MEQQTETKETELLRKYLLEIAASITAHKTRQTGYYRLWLALQSFIVFVAIVTPFIVFFRKSPLFPQQFWVVWCMVTPPLTGIASVAVQALNLREHYKLHRKKAGQLGNLVKRTELKLLENKTAGAVTEAYYAALKEADTIENEVL